MKNKRSLTLLVTCGGFMAAFAAHAHLIHSTPDAPTHNAFHLSPFALAALVGAALGFAALRPNRK
jgi:hypothetical protein